MRYTTQRSTSTSGLAYIIHQWEPDTEPIAQVLLLHGYAEYAQRYLPLIASLCEASMRVLAPDYVGHGLSDGLRGYIPKIEIAVDDTVKVLDGMISEHADIPTFIFGHSMGAAIATIIAARRNDRIEGLILSGASLIIANTPKFLQLLSPLPAALLPKVPFMPLKASDVSRDPDASIKYKDDPLNYVGKVRFGMGWQLIRAGRMALEVASKIDRPLWVGHGERDGLTAPAGSEQLLSKVRSTDKTYVLVPEARHEILNEPEGPKLVSEIVDWVVKRV